MDISSQIDDLRERIVLQPGYDVYNIFRLFDRDMKGFIDRIDLEDFIKYAPFTPAMQESLFHRTR